MTGGTTYFLLVFGDGTSAATSGSLVLTVARAVQPIFLSLELVSPVEPLTFRLELVAGTCDTGTFKVDSVQANGNAVTPVSVTEDPTDANAALMILPSNAPPGELVVAASCTDDSQQINAEQLELFATIAVTKTVEGPPPVDATFTVHVACSSDAAVAPDSAFVARSLPVSFDADLHYQASGGLKYVYSDHLVDCAFTEPVNGGASSVTIDPAHVVLVAPDLFTATVTNSFELPAVEIQPAFTG